MTKGLVMVRHGAHGTLVSFATTGLVLLLSLGASVLVARSLGPDGRGLLLALSFWPALLSSLTSVSLNESTAYHVAQRSASIGSMADIAASALGLTALIALVATVMTLAAMPTMVPAGYHEHLGTIAVYASAFVPLSALDLYFRAVLQGKGALAAFNIVRAVQPAGYFLIVLLCAVVGRLEVAAVMAAMIAALALSALTGAWMVGPRRMSLGKGSAKLLGTGWTFHRANMLLYGAAELDKLVVLLLLPVATAGHYAVAVAMSAIGTGAVVQSLGITLVRDMAASKDPVWQRRIFISNMRAALVVLVAVNGTAAALAAWWVPILFGEAFAAAVPAATILLVGGIFKGTRQMADRSLRAMHHTQTGMVGEAIAIAGIATSGTIGALAAGLEGLAYGIALAQAAALASVLTLSMRRLDVSWGALWPIQRATAVDERDFNVGRKSARRIDAPAAVSDAR